MIKYFYLRSNLGEIAKVRNVPTLKKITFTHPVFKDGSETTYFRLLRKAYFGTFELNRVNAVTEFLTTYDVCRARLNDLFNAGFITTCINGKYSLTDQGTKYVDCVSARDFKNFTLYKGVTFNQIIVANGDPNNKDVIELYNDEIKEFLEDNKDLKLNDVEMY